MAQLAVAAGATALELRADLVPASSVEKVLGGVSGVANGAGVPLVLTLRSRAEGGGFDGGYGESAALLCNLAEQAHVVDIELARPDIGELAARLKELGLSVIVSHHDFEGQPAVEEMDSLASRALAVGDVAKLAFMMSSPAQALDLYGFLVKTGGRLCVIGMGEVGRQTRLVAPLFGSVLTYGHTGREMAPGQLSVSELVGGLQLLGLY